jgi:hypothetical protein
MTFSNYKHILKSFNHQQKNERKKLSANPQNLLGKAKYSFKYINENFTKTAFNFLLAFHHNWKKSGTSG